MIFRALLCIGLLLFLVGKTFAELAADAKTVSLPPAFQSYIADGVSPDGNFCVIYPKRPPDGEDLPVVKNYLVGLMPFRIIKELPLDQDTAYSERKNHASFSTLWSLDSTSVVINVEGRWGPAKVFVIVLDAKSTVKKMFELTDLITKTADPLLKKAIEGYDSNGGYLLEDGSTATFGFDKDGNLNLNLFMTNDPKEMGGPGAWNATFKGLFDLKSGAITEAKIEKSIAQ